MGRLRVGMRWWLGGIFVLIAALTAGLVATVSSRQTARALRSNSEAIAVGKTVSAGFAVERSILTGTSQRLLRRTAERKGLALFVFGRDGHLISPAVSIGIRWTS